MDMSIGYYLQTPAVGSGDERPGVVLRDCLTQNYARLHRRLARHLGCTDQASECLHDAWLRLGEVCVSAAVQNPEAYIYRVACNAAIDRLRSYAMHHARHCADDAAFEIEQLADAAPGPDAIAEARCSLETMMRALQRLPRLHEAILTALRVDELSRQEVAGRYGLSVRNVDTMLRKTLEYCGQGMCL